MKYVLTIILATLLAACGQPTFEGTFVTPTDKNGFTFTADGKVRAAGKETTYTIDGKTIKFHFDGGMPAEFTINSDDSISWGGQIKYTKK